MLRFMLRKPSCIARVKLMSVEYIPGVYLSALTLSIFDTDKRSLRFIPQTLRIAAIFCDT